jgi:hypothetical protein
VTAATSIFPRSSDMTEAAQVMATLEAIEKDLAKRQNLLFDAARNWYVAKREKEHKRAITFLSTEGTVAKRNAVADRETALEGKEAEAEYEALRGVVRVMETRANIGMAILKAHGRS